KASDSEKNTVLGPGSIRSEPRLLALMLPKPHFVRFAEMSFIPEAHLLVYFCFVQFSCDKNSSAIVK
ncbi:hypothetical protein, partial [Pseudophaeobacter sp.]|uniref:hypothetical protein n=1 Tax=Pseudophaeobacter sp. TaxID=1971739 RepID=UPI0032993932